MVIADEDVVVVGGGPAGLAAALELSRARLYPLVLAAATLPGDIWRGHYERLHLHTARQLSYLPGEYLPRMYGTWVAKDAFGGYLDRYAINHIPRLRGNTSVSRVERFGYSARSSPAPSRFQGLYLSSASGRRRTDVA